MKFFYYLLAVLILSSLAFAEKKIMIGMKPEEFQKYVPVVMVQMVLLQVTLSRLLVANKMNIFTKRW